MLLNKKLLAMAVASLSMLSASSAYALNKNPNVPVATSSTPNGSTLLLTVWDKTTSTSYSQILETAGANSNASISYASFLAANSFSTETLNSANWTSFNNSVTWATDKVVYEVQAGYSTADTSGLFGLTTTVSTQADNSTSTYADNAAALTGLQTIINSGSAVQNFGSYLDAFGNDVKGGLGQLITSGNDAYSSGAGASSAWNASILGTNVNGTLGSAIALVAVGDNANFFFATNNTANDKQLGAWDLTVNAGVGSLSYTAAAAPAAVPVPGSIWLMISGLAGLVATTRRNKNA